MRPGIVDGQYHHGTPDPVRVKGALAANMKIVAGDTRFRRRHPQFIQEIYNPKKLHPASGCLSPANLEQPLRQAA